MKLPIDMNLSTLWVEFLAGFGFEIAHWSKSETRARLTVRSWITPRRTDWSSSPTISISLRCSQAVVRALRASQLQLEQGALVTVDH
jgi:predicted nuclease of predicted toxin-antitoxin system